MLFSRYSGCIFWRIAPDERILFKINNLTADRAAFIGEPVNASGSNFFWLQNSSCRCVNARYVFVPVISKSVRALACNFSLSEHPSWVDLVYTNTIFAMQCIAEISGH